MIYIMNKIWMFLGQSTEFNLKHSFLLLFALESLVKLYHKKKNPENKKKKEKKLLSDSRYWHWLLV